jgi:hypothetical protein
MNLIRPVAMLSLFIASVLLIGVDTIQDPDTHSPGETYSSDRTNQITDWEITDTIIESPEEYRSLISLGIHKADVNGDHIDDIITHNWSEWDGQKGRDRGPDNIIILGRYDRDMANATYIVISDVSHSFGIGDVNGDGFEEVASYPYPTYSDHHYYPDVSNPTNIQIRFGSPNGPSADPDQVIDLDHGIETPEEEVIFCMCADVGDVNGDGYDDLIAIFRRTDTYRGNHLTNEARIQLFYGSNGGLSMKPDMDERMNDEFIDNVSYERYIDHGDFNGDGYSDVIVQCWSYNHGDSYFDVRHGSRDGITVEPDVVLNPQYSGYIITEPRVIDYDGDGYDDFGFQGREHGYEYDEIDRTVILRGSTEGLTEKPGLAVESRREGPGHGNVTWVKFADINADGLDEVVLINVTSLGTRYKDEHNYQVFKWKVDIEYHINMGGRLKHSQMIYETEFGWDSFYPRMVGDFDGDGADDILITRAFGGLSPPGEPEIPGTNRLWIIHGEGCRYKGDPVHLIDDHRLYAGYKSYDFQVNVDPTRPTYYDHLRLTLDPGVTDVSFSWRTDPVNGSWFSPSTHELAKLTSDASVQKNTTGGKSWVSFSTLFDWDWPHEDPFDILVEYIKDGDVKYSYTSENLVSVENDITLIGPLQASGEIQGPLQVGDWVQGGEVVTFSGPHVVYQGTTDVYPPAGSFEIVVYDHDERFVIVQNPPDGYVNISFQVVDNTEHYRTHMLKLQRLPGTAKGPAPMTFVVNVDADAPVFRNAMPDGNEWIATNNVLVGITADDNGMSGVDASTLEFAFRGSMGYGSWTRSEVMTDPDGQVVNGTATVFLPDGDDYHLKWRVSDLVGNIAMLPEEIQLRIDTRNVSFTESVPGKFEWQNSTRVLVGTTIRDLEGSGIDVSSVMYRISHNNVSGYGEWKRYTGQHTDSRKIEARVYVDMGEGINNYIQWRAADIAGNGPKVSEHFNIIVDTVPITFRGFQPRSTASHEDVEVSVVADDGPMGSGVDHQSIQFRYRSGEVGYTAWESVKVESIMIREVVDGETIVRIEYQITSIIDKLVEGDNNLVQFRGYDELGNGPAISKEYRISVDSEGPLISIIQPMGGEVQRDPVVTFTIRLSDPVSGIDVERVRFRHGTEGEESFGNWSRMPVMVVGEGYEGTISITMERGRDNWVQFESFDKMGNRGFTPPTVVWVNRLPIANINWPKDGEEFVGVFEGMLNADGTLDPDGDPLTYEWFVDGESRSIGSDPQTQIQLDKGGHEITLVVTDPYGGTSEETISIVVKDETYQFSSGWAILLILVVVVAVVAAIIYLRYRPQKDD